MTPFLRICRETGRPNLKNLKTNIALFENFVETGNKLSRVLKPGKAGKNGQIWVSVTSAGYSRRPVYNGNDLFGSRRIKSGGFKLAKMSPCTNMNFNEKSMPAGMLFVYGEAVGLRLIGRLLA